MHTLIALLSTPLADLRAYRMEERCCGEPGTRIRFVRRMDDLAALVASA